MLQINPLTASPFNNFTATILKNPKKLSLINDQGIQARSTLEYAITMLCAFVTYYEFLIFNFKIPPTCSKLVGSCNAFTTSVLLNIEIPSN